MARYDYGLRGPQDTTDPRFHDWTGPGYFGGPRRPETRLPPPARASARYESPDVRPASERSSYEALRDEGHTPQRLDRDYQYERADVAGTRPRRDRAQAARYGYGEFERRLGNGYPDER